MKSTTIAICTGLALLAFSAIEAGAVSIAIPDYSFETGGRDSVWTVAAGAGWGRVTFAEGSPDYFPAPHPPANAHGSFYRYLVDNPGTSGSISQELTTTYVADSSYTFGVSVGHRIATQPDPADVRLQLGFLTGGTTFVLVAERVILRADILDPGSADHVADGSFEAFQFDVGPSTVLSAGALGEQIVVRLATHFTESSGSALTAFDVVTLDRTPVPVPEPGCVLCLLVSGLALAAPRRRRRAG